MQRQNYLAAKMHPKTRYKYFLQGLEISENNVGHSVFELQQTSAPTKDKYLFCLCFLICREVEQVVSPTAGLHNNPGNSTRRKFQMDTCEECIPEPRFHMNPCRERDMNAIHRKIQIQEAGQTTNKDPSTTRHPMKGHVQKRKASKKHLFGP